MVFSSLMFMCIFLPIVLIAYNLSKNLTYKNTVLIIASLFFYAWGEPIWVVLLIFSAFVDYINGRIIDKYYARAGATIALVSSLVINLGLLAMFKYSGFFIENINTFLHTSIPNPNFKLPIGISFYTFQTLSYTIDMYRGKTRVQKSFLGFLAYVSMFPQLVAGPIVRYSTVASELNSRRVTADDFAYGVKRFTAGMCKKVMLANSSGAVASMVLDSTRLTVASSWLGIIMYTFQIYFDFSGYFHVRGCFRSLSPARILFLRAVLPAKSKLFPEHHGKGKGNAHGQNDSNGKIHIVVRLHGDKARKSCRAQCLSQCLGGCQIGASCR